MLLLVMGAGLLLLVAVLSRDMERVLSRFEGKSLSLNDNCLLKGD